MATQQKDQKDQKEISLLKKARDLLRVTPKSSRTEALSAAVEQFQECWDIIKVSCSQDACIAFVGAATRLVIVLDAMTAPPSTPPRSGAGDSEKTLAKQAAVG